MYMNMYIAAGSSLPTNSLLPGLPDCSLILILKTQGFGFENKETEALSVRQDYGCFFSGSPQVNALRGVCGGDGVKRVVCR